MKSISPSAEPWGTPESTLTGSDETPFTIVTTNCLLSDSQLWVHFFVFVYIVIMVELMYENAIVNFIKCLC